MRNHIHRTPTRKIQMKQNKMIFAIAFAVTLLIIPRNVAAQDKAGDEPNAGEAQESGVIGIAPGK